MCFLRWNYIFKVIHHTGFHQNTANWGFYMVEMHYRSVRHQNNEFFGIWSENMVFVTCFSCTTIQNFRAPGLHHRSSVIGQNFGRGERTEPCHGATAHPRPLSVKDWSLNSLYWMITIRRSAAWWWLVSTFLPVPTLFRLKLILWDLSSKNNC